MWCFKISSSLQKLFNSMVLQVSPNGLGSNRLILETLDSKKKQNKQTHEM